MPLGLCAFEWLFIYEGIPSTDRKYQEEIFHVKWKVDFGNRGNRFVWSSVC